MAIDGKKQKRCESSQSLLQFEGRVDGINSIKDR